MKLILDNITNLVKNNQELNLQEYNEKKVFLSSFPQTVFVQMDAMCNQNCLFCSRPDIYKCVTLEEFKNKFENVLYPILERANLINLTGSGEFLLLPDAKQIINYFCEFKYSEKMFATNGTTLTPKMIDYIIATQQKFTIHISLHGSNKYYRKLMVQDDNFNLLISNLNYIKNKKEKGELKNIRLNFIFVATTKNIDDLVEFVKFSSEYKPDNIIVYYNYIYRLDQKFLSCYFEQQKTNYVLDKAKDVAESYGISIILPPKFKQQNYPETHFCIEAWSNMMINFNGDVIPCDVSGDTYENIFNKSFEEVWNGKYYTELRKSLIKENNSCFQNCFRANPSAVNNFRSHIIVRGKSESEIERFLEGTENL